MGVYGKYDIPHKSLNKMYNATKLGFNRFNFIVEGLFHPRFALFADVGLNIFDVAHPGLDDMKIWDILGNLKYYPLIGTFQTAFFAGGGMYFLNPGDEDWGLNLGASEEWRITTHLSLEAKYNYNNVFTPGDKTIFSNAQLGLRFRF